MVDDELVDVLLLQRDLLVDGEVGVGIELLLFHDDLGLILKLTDPLDPQRAQVVDLSEL